jgi:tight adherence protein B
MTGAASASGRALWAGLLVFCLAVGALAWLRAALVGWRRSRVRLPLTPARIGTDALAGLAVAGAWTRRAPAVDRILQRRAERRYAVQLPLALDVAAASLRSGATMASALSDAARVAGGPLGDDLAATVRHAETAGMHAALGAWGAARPLRPVQVAAAAWSMGADTGGRLAAALEGLAASLRDRDAAAAEARALSAQARLSAIVIAAAPVAFCGFTAITDRTTAGFLIGSPIGLLCLVVGLALDGAGWWWMSRITSFEATS